MEILQAKDDVSSTYPGRTGFSLEASLSAGLRAHGQWHWEVLVKEGDTHRVMKGCHQKNTNIRAML